MPFPAGGPADVAARLLAQRMNEDWGQPVIVDNRPGGNTVIGAQQVAKAAPDGYTLLMAIDSTLVMNQYLYKSLPYDPINDFAPITTTTKTVSVLAVSGETGPKSVKELIAKAKAEPGKLNYGAGTITAQLMGYRFHKAAGLDIVYVPFKGTPETVNGLLTGSVQIIYAANVTVNPLIESGKVRALAKLDRRTAGVDGEHSRRSPTPPACRTSRTCRSGSASSRPRARRSRSSTSCSRRSRRSWPIRRCARNPSAPARSR